MKIYELVCDKDHVRKSDAIVYNNSKNKIYEHIITEYGISSNYQ